MRASKTLFKVASRVGSERFFAPEAKPLPPRSLIGVAGRTTGSGSLEPHQSVKLPLYREVFQ